jgi:uncharacterized cupin superfamily protein
MRRFNLFADEPAYDATDPAGFRAGGTRFSDAIGSAQLIGNLLELPEGQSNCPYHYEYGVEEWLIVLSGRVRVRHPEGEEELDAGDVVCFPQGPGGAHRITGASAEPARLIMLSDKLEPGVAVYPDSDKIGVWTGERRDDLMVRRADGSADYWEGEV